MKNRRVGTLTLGIMLITIGGFFLISNIMGHTLNYEILIELWPVILIMLGGEVLLSYIFNKEELLKYDIPGAILILIMGVFSLSMGIIQFIFENWKIIF